MRNSRISIFLNVEILIVRVQTFPKQIISFMSHQDPYARVYSACPSMFDVAERF